MRGPWVSLWGALLLLLLLGTTDGYLNGQINSCEFNSTVPDDMRFISSYFYNKLEYLRFDSDIGRFVGYTEFGVKVADRFNNDQAMLSRMRMMKYIYCAHNAQIMYSNILSKSAAPYALITTAPSKGQLRVLVCNVYGFFPKNISVTWTNHTKDVTDAVVTTTGPMPDSDWYYQQHTQLEYYPRPGDKISCVIEHVSLKEPIILDYDGGLSHMDLLLIGASGLVLSLVVSLTGFLCYMCPKKKPKWQPLG